MRDEYGKVQTAEALYGKIATAVKRSTRRVVGKNLRKLIRVLSKLRHGAFRAGLPVVATIAAVCLTAGGCGLLNGAGFGDENDSDCGPPRGVQTVEKYSKQVCSKEQKQLPTPSMAQSNEIISKIEGFGPKPGIDPDRLGPATFSVCVSMIGDASPGEIAPHAAKWFGRGDHKLSLAQSRTIVDLIETQGWCVT